MKVIVLQHPDGTFLNTDYHSSMKHGDWRSEPRLYKSMQGIRAALHGKTTPAFVRVVGIAPARPVGQWTDAYSLARRAYWEAVHRIPTDQYFALLAEDGYKLIEKEIKV